jgi:hypothetical protein
MNLLTGFTWAYNLVLLLVLIPCQFAFAQSEDVLMTIKVVRVYGTYNADNEDEDYRFRIWYNGSEVGSSCLAVDNISVNTPVDVNYTVVSNRAVKLSDVITLEVDAWEEDGCSNCLYTSGGGCGDDGHCGKGTGLISGTGRSTFTLRDQNLKPGSVSASENHVIIFYCGGQYRVWYQVTYTIPTPSTPTVSMLNATTASPCDVSRTVELSTATSLPTNVYSQVSYHWEYSRPYIYQQCIPNPDYCPGECTAPPDPNWVEPSCCIFDPEFCFESCTAPPDPNWIAPDCCYEPSCIGYEDAYGFYFSSIPGGVTQPYINGGKLTVDIRSLPGLENLRQSINITFRVRASANSTSSSPSVVSITVRIDPLPPSVTEPILTAASCVEKGTGKITLANISGVLNLVDDPSSRYGYILRKGANNTAPCTPGANGAPGDCMQAGSESGSFMGTSYTIGVDDMKKILAGEYTLLLTNPGGKYGVCYKPYAVSIAGIPELTVTESITSIACNGSPDGSVVVTTHNGDPSAVTYSLTKPGFNETRTSNQPESSVSFTSLSSGLYTLTINDGNCSSEVQMPVSITQPRKVLESTFEPTSPFATCLSPGNGSMRVTVSETSVSQDLNVSDNYQFTLYKKDEFNNWVPYSNSDQGSATWEFNQSLPAGDYELQAKESGGALCNSYVKPFTVTPPHPLSADVNATRASLVNETCDYGNDGSLIVSGASGGSSSFDFELRRVSDNAIIPDKVSENGTFENLQKGYYELTVKNALPGCTDKVTYSTPADHFFIDEPQPLDIALTPASITCSDLNDGNVVSLVTGGTKRNSPATDYAYTWYQELSPGTWSELGSKRDQATISTLQEGVYRLDVRDKNNCFKTSNTVTILRPEELVIDSVKVSDIQCFGEKGAIRVYASGGTAPINFEYAPAAGISFSGLTALTPMNAGTYKVRAKDKNNCTQTDGSNTYTITAPPTALDFSVTQSLYNGYNISCFNGGNGVATVSATGGNGGAYTGYTFTIGSRGYASTNVLENITAGSHPLSVRDDRGCVVTKTVTFTQAPALLTSTVVKQHIDCFGDSTGTLELSVTGGAGTFRYQLGSATPQTTPRFEELSAGTYSFSIIDDNNCSTTYSDNLVNLHPPVTGTAAIEDVLCHRGSDGSINLTVTGGAPGPYTYELAGTGLRPHPVSNLSAGTYDIIVRDSKGCVFDMNDLQVNEPAQLQIDTVAFQDIVCAGEKGSIDMTASGGTAPYQFSYSVNNNNTFAPFTASTPLDANTYALRVADAQGCITAYPTTVSLTAPSRALDVSYQLSDYNGFNVSCFGGNNGFVTLTGVGGNGASYTGYAFALDGSVFQTETIINRVNAGPHILAVRDGRGCVLTKTITLTQSADALAVSLARKDNVKCFYETTGSFEVAAQGGVGPYAYWLNPGSKQTTAAFAQLAVGNYTVTVQDKNECETLLPVSIESLHPSFSLAFGKQDVNCFEGQDGTVALTVSGGVTPFSYRWKNMAETSSTLRNLRAGSYEVTVTDGAGCFVTESLSIFQPAEPLRISRLTTYTACYNQDNGAVTIEAEGGTPPYQYSINNGSTFFPEATIRSATGTASVMVRDKNGCSVTSTTSVAQRNVRPEPNFLVSSKQNALDTLVLTDVSVPRPDSVAWAFDGNTIVIDSNPSAPMIRFAEEGNYAVTMTGYFGDCAYPVTKTIFLNPFDPDREEDGLPGVKPIQSVIASPNPSTGDFTVVVTLNRKRNLSMVVYAITGNIVYQNNYADVQQVNQYISLGTAANGLYLVRVITEADAKEVKVILDR